MAAHCHLGLEVNGWTEDAEAARHASVDLARRALRSGADDASVLALAAFVLGYFGEDIDLAPSFPVTYRVLAACYVHMGRLDEAREIVRRLRGITPAVIESAIRYRDPGLRELFLSGLRLAAAEAV